MRTLWQDLRFGLRMLAKHPGFTAVAVLTLGLGIGANTAIFSVVNGVVLNALPFPDSHQLVSVYFKTSQADADNMSYPNFLDWERTNQTLSSLAAYRPADYTLTGAGEPERLGGMMISADFFSALGMQPTVGRFFRREEDQIGAPPVVLISEGLWRRRFGSSSEVVNKTLTLAGTNYSVVGVVPARLPMFDATAYPDVFTPIGQWGDPTFRDRKTSLGTRAIGRIKPDVSLAQVRGDFDSVARNLAAAYPDADKNTGIVVVPLKKDIVGDSQGILYVLLGAVGFVLLISCANVANLLLARSTGRAREFTVRMAMGASRMRVIRQLLSENLLLALAGAILGLTLAKWGTSAVLAALPTTLPRTDDIRIDSHVLLFTLGVSALAGILFGLAPAVKTFQPDLGATLREGGRGTGGVRHRTQSVLVVVEMALSMILLIGAGLMIRSLAALWHVNPGFQSQGVLSFNVSMSPQRISTPAKTRQSLRELVRTLNSVSGIEGASVMGGSLPMLGDSELPFWREGQPKPASENEMSAALFYAVQPDYLKVMGIPLRRGRFVSDSDDEKSPLAVIIDENFAREYFPDEDPIGKRLNVSIMNVQGQIVGVVGHVKHWGLADTAHQNLQAQFYFPIMQVPDQFFSLFSEGQPVVVRTGGPPQAFTQAIRAASAQFDANQVAYEFHPMDEIVSNSIAPQRFAMLLLGIFAALALVLSAVGIYGVVSYLAGQRTHEIGIRMAIGAQPKDVLRMVLGDGARVSLIGVAVGLVASFGLTRLLSKMIFGVAANDPFTFVGFAVLLMLVALAACYIPARRATRIDPLKALQYE